MAELLEIDGKMYEPSTAIAGAFGYTADYVSKLAREGKVLAEQVGRTWYVDRNSLTDFSHQASKQKIARKETLRTERKLERVIRSEQAVLEPVALPHVAHTFAQAVMLFMVLTVSAGAALVAVDEGVGARDIALGAAAVTHDMTSLGHGEMTSISGDTQVAFLGWLKHYWWWQETEVVELAGPVSQKTSPPTPTPVARNQAGLVLLDATTDEEVVNTVRAMFSDPVKVDFNTGDSGYLTPVFEERSDESYRFLIVPVVPKNE